MPTVAHNIEYAQVRNTIDKLIDNLVNIKDETGEFLLKLDDGRVIDTKGWAGWEWTHGIGLYGLMKYWDITWPICMSIPESAATSRTWMSGRSGSCGICPGPRKMVFSILSTTQ